MMRLYSRRGHDWGKLHEAFFDIASLTPDANIGILPTQYAELFKAAIGERVVRRPEHANAQLQIYGQLEARLTESDRVILGGLVEGVWPPAPRVDPWLSRPMRH